LTHPQLYAYISYIYNIYIIYIYKYTAIPKKMPKIRPFAGPPASAMDTLWDAPPTVEEVPEDGSGNGARRDPIPHPFSLQKP
jgi:hypothetical protein